MLTDAPAPRRKRLPMHKRWCRKDSDGEVIDRKPFKILDLPNDIFVVIIKDHLTIFDRAAFALACKKYAEKVTAYQPSLQLSAAGSAGEDENHLNLMIFFRNTMRSWFPADLKFCQICGKYVPRSIAYWRATLLRECAGKAGKTARNFFAWSASTHQKNSMTYHYTAWRDLAQSRTCPRCKLHIRHF
jgi:hypothetical protein